MSKKKWKQCGSKKRYRDEHTANHFRKMFEHKRGKKLDYYWCYYCNGYHLTSLIKSYDELCFTDCQEAV